jgi:hypothetical protein
MKKMFNEGNQIDNFMSSSGSGTVINYGSDFLTSSGSGYGSGYGSGSTSQKVTVPTVPVPVPVPVPQHCFGVLRYPSLVVPPAPQEAALHKLTQPRSVITYLSGCCATQGYPAQVSHHLPFGGCATQAYPAQVSHHLSFRGCATHAYPAQVSHHLPFGVQCYPGLPSPGKSSPVLQGAVLPRFTQPR